MSGLETEFPGQVTAMNVDATTDDAKVEVQQLGFKNHGLVIRSPEGEAIWSQPDHQVQIEDVRGKLTELLE